MSKEERGRGEGREGWGRSCRTFGPGEDSGFYPEQVGAWRAVGRGGPGPDSGVHGHTLMAAVGRTVSM